MSDVIRRNAAGRVGIVIVLDRGTTARTILHVEVTATYVRRFAERVGNKRVKPVGEATLQLRLQSVVVRPADRFGEVDVGRHPWHRTSRIDCGRGGSGRKRLVRGIAQTGIWQAAVLATDVRRRQSGRGGDLALQFEVPLYRVPIFITGIVCEGLRWRPRETARSRASDCRIDVAGR